MSFSSSKLYTFPSLPSSNLPLSLIYWRLEPWAVLQSISTKSLFYLWPCHLPHYPQHMTLIPFSQNKEKPWQNPLNFLYHSPWCKENGVPSDCAPVPLTSCFLGWPCIVIYPWMSLLASSQEQWNMLKFLTSEKYPNIQTKPNKIKSFLWPSDSYIFSSFRRFLPTPPIKFLQRLSSQIFCFFTFKSLLNSLYLAFALKTLPRGHPLYLNPWFNNLSRILNQLTAG